MDSERDLSDSTHALSSCKIQSGVTRQKMSNNLAVGNGLRAAAEGAIVV